MSITVAFEPSGVWGNATAHVEVAELPQVGDVLALSDRFLTLKGLEDLEPLVVEMASFTSRETTGVDAIVSFEPLVTSSRDDAARLASQLEHLAGMFCIEFD